MNRTLANITRWVATERGKDVAIALLRVLTGAMMLSHGLQKMANFAVLAETFPDPIGLGAKFSLTLITAAEAGGSLLLILGLLTRPAALALAIGMIVAAFVVHSPFTIAGSELPLLYLVVCISLMISGGGRYSLDRLLLDASRK